MNILCACNGTKSRVNLHDIAYSGSCKNHLRLFFFCVLETISTSTLIFYHLKSADRFLRVPQNFCTKKVIEKTSARIDGEDMMTRRKLTGDSFRS